MWLLFLLQEWVSFTHDVLLANIRVSLICLNFIAPLWLINIFLFTNQVSRKNTWLIPAILVVPSALSALLLFSESSAILKLYIKELILEEQGRFYFLTWGPLETLTGIYALCCVFLSFLLLLGYFRKNNLVKLAEKITALFILCLPITAHYLGVFFKSPFDFKPLTFSLWGAITVYLLCQRQFFNAVPSLVWNIFNITKESMIVLGADGSVNVNKTFIEEFGCRGNDFLGFTDELFPGLSGYIQQKHDVDGLEAEKDGIQYKISIQNVLGGRNKVMGQLVTISDISETKQLTLAEERSRIASGLHDSMGNCLIASVNNLHLAMIQPTLEEAKPFTDFAATFATASLMTLRIIVEGLSPVNFNETKLIPLIESVINRISASGIFVDLNISGELENLPTQIKEFVYGACQEALTNSVIHGRAENILIKLEYTGCIFWLNIMDDGRGCEKVYKNNGLNAMEERAENLGGKISFGSPSSGGFGIYAEIPVTGGEQA